MQIDFGLQSYEHASLPLSAQQLINAYLEPAPAGAKTKSAVVPSFGIRPVVALGAQGVIRGGTVVNDVMYIVSGVKLYRVNATGAATALGAIPGSGPVFMDGDGTNVMVTANGPAYVYNGTSVAQITDPDFPGAQWVAFLDGFMVIGPGNGTVWVNETPYVPAAWNALDFASAEAAPDDIVVGIVDHRELFLFGRETTEVWYNSGAADFPLTRTASGFMEVGCSSKYGPVKINNSIYFPANDGTIRRVDGYTPVRISTYAVEQAIAGYADKIAMGKAWIENGHSMVAFTYAQATWVYDVSTQLWHKRASYGRTNWRAQMHLRANNLTYVGDSTSNRVGVMDADLFTEWGDPLVSTVTSPAVSELNQPIEHARLELVFEQGTGVVSGQGSDPQVMLQWSDTGGRTWSNELWRSLGKIGQYKRRCMWNRLGQSRDRVYRYSISDPVRRTLILATLNEL